MTQMRAAAQRLGAVVTVEPYLMANAADLSSTFAAMLRVDTDHSNEHDRI